MPEDQALRFKSSIVGLLPGNIQDIIKSEVIMRLFSALFLVFITFNVIADQKAVTEEGDVVILNSDGSWVYENGKPDSVTG